MADNENPPTVTDLVTLIKREWNNNIRIYELDQLDAYSAVGASYITMRRMAENSSSPTERISLLEKDNMKEFKRLKEAADKVPYNFDIPTTKDKE